MYVCVVLVQFFKRSNWRTVLWNTRPTTRKPSFSVTKVSFSCYSSQRILCNIKSFSLNFKIKLHCPRITQGKTILMEENLQFRIFTLYSSECVKWNFPVGNSVLWSIVGLWHISCSFCSLRHSSPLINFWIFNTAVQKFKLHLRFLNKSIIKIFCEKYLDSWPYTISNSVISNTQKLWIYDTKFLYCFRNLK